jgi:choline dehydrogenase-like flavoprotein
MLIDATHLPGDMLESEVCIVGAGAAGIAIARELSKARIRSVLVESGGIGFREDVQDLSEGRADGIAPLFSVARHPTKQRHKLSNYPYASRLRQVGGATAMWGGFCRPLDPIDFKVREWVPHSGWPMPFDALYPWYLRAADVLGIKALVGTGEPTPSPLLAGDAFDLVYYHRSVQLEDRTRPIDLGKAYREELIGSAHATLLTNATCVDLTHKGSQVRSADLKTLSGKRLAVRSRCFILAAGAYENARLLLVAGLGNQGGHVGRYLMDHLNIIQGSAFISRRPRRLFDQLATHPLGTPNHYGTVVFSPSEQLQREQRILNCCLEFETPLVPPWRFRLKTWKAVRRFIGRLPYSRGYVTLRSEQQPDPENRITLGTERDALGVPKLQVHWRPSPLDLQTLDLCRELLAKSLPGVLLIGLHHRVVLAAHHSGTTRMSAAAADGVVDPDCRVHGTGNLYVAGNSVFPTGGWANPTYTNVALSLRLAERLRTLHASQRDWEIHAGLA